MSKKRISDETRETLERFAASADGGSVSPEIVALLPIIARILDGEEPNRVFGWSAPRGRPKSDKAWERNWRIAVDVCRLQDRDGETLESAREQVAEKYRVSEATVKRAWEKFHVPVQYLSGARRPPPIKITRRDGTVVEIDRIQFSPPIDADFRGPSK